MKILELGSGEKPYFSKNPKDAIVHLDKFKLPHVEKVWDLEKIPLPFKDNEFDLVIANHTLEHIKNFFHLIDDVWRILKPNGIFIIRAPYFRSHTAFASVEHVNFFSATSFDQYRQNAYYSYSVKARFEVSKKLRWIIQGKLKFLNIFNPILNLNPNAYEILLSHILPVEEIQYELKAIK